MLYELVLSLRQCVYALLGAERSLPWFALLPPIVLALMIVPLVGCGDKSGDKPAPARPVRYVVIGSPATLPSLERTGEIHAHDETALSFRTAGRMMTRAVDIGDRVNYGQLLATLDDTSAQNQLDSATADEESARATARVAALNVSRMQKLIATGAIARSQLDSARADWLVASARVKSSEAALRNARESLGWTRLTSPGEGIITAVSASPGQVVNAGETVVTLAAGQARDVVFDIPDPAKVEAQRAEEFQVALLSDAGVNAFAILRDISPRHGKAAVIRFGGLRGTGFGAEPLRRKTGRLCDYPADAGAAARCRSRQLHGFFRYHRLRTYARRPGYYRGRK